MEHFADESIRGYLMVALAGLGEPLVPQLEELYRGDPDGAWRRADHAPAAADDRRGSPASAPALAEVVTHARGSDLDEAARNLLIGRPRAGRALPADREHSADSRAAGRPGAPPGELGQPTHRRLAHDLAALGWDGAVTAELIERVVAGVATQEERSSCGTAAGGRPMAPCHHRE